MTAWGCMSNITEYYMSLDEFLACLTKNISPADLNATRLLSSISNAIIHYRQERGMTKPEFAQTMNVSQAIVSEWESGDYNFTIKQLCEICKNLGIMPQIKFDKLKK